MQISTKIKATMATMEEDIKRKRQKLSKDDLEAKFKEWVPDSGNSRTRDTKIFKLIELYWMNKDFIAQVVEERGNQQQAIMWKLNMMDHKFYALCKEVFNIQTIINSYRDITHSLGEDIEQFPDLASTSLNPILVDDESDVQKDRCY